MKTEIINVPGKGICILISDFSLNELNQIVGSHAIPTIDAYRWTDIMEIARCIRNGKKIQGIKEIRGQTGMGLKEAKEYIEKYMPCGMDYSDNPIGCQRAAERFIRDFLSTDSKEHSFENFLGNEDFNV